MSAIAFLREMLAAGLDFESALVAADRFEQRAIAASEARANSRRAKDAARQQAKRDRERHAESRGQAVTCRDSRGPSPHVGEPAQVVTLPSSLRSEGTQEANASFVDASNDAKTPAPPEKPKTRPPKARGTRLPEDWEPSVAEIELARDQGLTPEEINRAALEFRNYWCSRSRDAAKLSWSLTWHNRVIVLGERKRRDGARLAAAAAKPGGGRRGATSFADLYMRRHGEAEDRDPVPG